MTCSKLAQSNKKAQPKLSFLEHLLRLPFTCITDEVQLHLLRSGK